MTKNQLKISHWLKSLNVFLFLSIVPGYLFILGYSMHHGISFIVNSYPALAGYSLVAIFWILSYSVVFAMPIYFISCLTGKKMRFHFFKTTKLKVTGFVIFFIIYIGISIFGVFLFSGKTLNEFGILDTILFLVINFTFSSLFVYFPLRSYIVEGKKIKALIGTVTLIIFLGGYSIITPTQGTFFYDIPAKMLRLQIDNGYIKTNGTIYKNATVLRTDISPTPFLCNGIMHYDQIQELAYPQDIKNKLDGIDPDIVVDCKKLPSANNDPHTSTIVVNCQSIKQLPHNLFMASKSTNEDLCIMKHINILDHNANFITIKQKGSPVIKLNNNMIVAITKDKDKKTPAL